MTACKLDLPIHIFDVFGCNKCRFIDNQNVFYGYGTPTEHQVMWIFNNPGGSEINKTAEKETKVKDSEEKATYWRNDFKNWLWYNKLVFSELLHALNKYELIQGLPNLGKYNEGRWKVDEQSYRSFIQKDDDSHSAFFDMIYVTDIMKCKGYKIKKKRGGEESKELVKLPADRSNCVEQFLHLELEDLVELKLIMTFGAPAWEGIKRHFENRMQLLAYPSILEYQPDPNKVTESHSSIWYVNEKNLFIIPLAHIANNSRTDLVNSYTGFLTHPIEGSIPSLFHLQNLVKHFN